MSTALTAELFKLRTTRTSWAVMGGSVLLVVIISLIAALAGDFDEPGGTPPGQDIMSIAGLVQIFALVMGILIVATEFRHGTITPTLLAVPDRVRLMLAKLVAGFTAGALLGLIAGVLCALIIFPIFSARDIDSEVTTGHVIELIVGNMAASALFAALGVGLGALIRNQVGAIIGALGWLFLVEPLLGIIPGFDDAIGKWFPSGAANETAGTSGVDDALAQLPAALLLAAYVAVFVAAGIAVVRRRDVSA